MRSMRPGFQTSLAIAGFRKEPEILRFAQNDIMKWFVGNIIAVFVIAGLGAAASAAESYKFDPSGSTIGFSVH